MKLCRQLLVQILLLVHSYHVVKVGCVELGSQSEQQSELQPPAAAGNSSWESPASAHEFALALQHLVLAKDRLARDFVGLVTSVNSTLSVFRRWEDNWERELPQLIMNAIFSNGNSSVSGEEARMVFS